MLRQPLADRPLGRLSMGDRHHDRRVKALFSRPRGVQARSTAASEDTNVPSRSKRTASTSTIITRMLSHDPRRPELADDRLALSRCSGAVVPARHARVTTML